MRINFGKFLSKINKFTLMTSEQYDAVKKISVICNQKLKICNEQIPNLKNIKLINDEDNSVIGIFDKQTALYQAQQNNKDIILVTENVDPIICKMVDYKFMMYQQFKKKMQEIDKKSSEEKNQSISLTDKITQHDLQIKLEKNIQQAQKRKFQFLTITMVSNMQNKENALQVYFNCEKISKGKLLAIDKPKISGMINGEYQVFDNIRSFIDKKFADDELTINLKQKFKIIYNDQYQIDQLGDKKLIEKINDIYQKVKQIDYFKQIGNTNWKEMYVLNDIGQKIPYKDLQIKQLKQQIDEKPNHDLIPENRIRFKDVPNFVNSLPSNKKSKKKSIKSNIDQVNKRVGNKYQRYISSKTIELQKSGSYEQKFDAFEGQIDEKSKFMSGYQDFLKLNKLSKCDDSLCQYVEMKEKLLLDNQFIYNQ